MGWVLYQYVINKPIGTGKLGLASQKEDPLTGEEHTDMDRCLFFVEGVLDLVSLGRGKGLSEGGKKFVVKYLIDKAGEELAVQLLKVSFDKLGLDAKEEAILGMYVVRFILTSRAKDLKELLDVAQEAINVGMKAKEFGDLIKLKLKIDINIAVNSDEVFEDIKKQYELKNKKQYEAFKGEVESKYGVVTEELKVGD